MTKTFLEYNVCKIKEGGRERLKKDKGGERMRENSEKRNG